MRVVNLYYSSTKNTAMVAKRIESALKQAGHTVDTLNMTSDLSIDVLDYDMT